MAKKPNQASVEGTVTIEVQGTMSVPERSSETAVVTDHGSYYSTSYAKPRAPKRTIHALYPKSDVLAASAGTGEGVYITVRGFVVEDVINVADINKDIAFDGDTITITDADGETHILTNTPDIRITIEGETVAEGDAKPKGKAAGKKAKKEESAEEESEESEEEEKPKKGKDKKAEKAGKKGGKKGKKDDDNWED